jgi:hypothetical protein
MSAKLASSGQLQSLLTTQAIASPFGPLLQYPLSAWMTECHVTIPYVALCEQGALALSSQSKVFQINLYFYA